jgi:RimJ/RimL family protein N-acetyltransferase
MVLNVPGGLPAEYPREFEQEITLKDGARVRIRPVLPEDEPRLVTLYGRLSRDTAYQRFFTVMKRLPPDWAYYFANVDYRRRMALVVERDLEWRPELIGVARYESSDEEDTAEIALVVQDYWQGKGLGTILLEEILRAGEANGIRRFRAYALADNHRILAMLSRLTDVQQRKIEQGVVNILLTRRATAAIKSRPEGQALTLSECVCAFGQANQRVLGELIELSSSVARESLRTYAELGRNSFAWYRTSLLHAADASRRAVKFLEANARIIAAASSLPGFCIRE